MTQDQIIQMLHKVVAENQNFTTWTVSTPHLVALVHHAIAELESQELVCPECKAEVLYECVACSSNNYPRWGKHDQS
jgi:hypothetical protein